MKVGIIGTGNIGTDLLYKIKRSDYLQCEMFVGRNSESKGIKLANEMGVKTYTNSIEAFVENPKKCDIVFDATSATVHKRNAKLFSDLNIFAIDLTPARIGQMCVPTINLDKCLNLKNVNMITCGGQATLPLIHAVHKVCPDIEYVEVVASISAKSAGPGTRENIDEFTQTTKDAIVELGGINHAKAIITLNPAEPPVNMHNTIFFKIHNPKMDLVRMAVREMEKKVQAYVPGYKVVLAPVLENGRVTTSIQVKGAGDYLPEYAGNLDIITCAAVRIAEQYVIKNLGEIRC